MLVKKIWFNAIVNIKKISWIQRKYNSCDISDKNKILKKKKRKDKILKNKKKRLDASCIAYKIYKIIEMQQGRC